VVLQIQFFGNRTRKRLELWIISHCYSAIARTGVEITISMKTKKKKKERERVCVCAMNKLKPINHGRFVNWKDGRHNHGMAFVVQEAHQRKMKMRDLELEKFFKTPKLMCCCLGCKFVATVDSMVVHCQLDEEKRTTDLVFRKKQETKIKTNTNLEEDVLGRKFGPTSNASNVYRHDRLFF
jgi:hypothetical protein